jgi:hypothetical protein
MVAAGRMKLGTIPDRFGVVCLVALECLVLAGPFGLAAACGGSQTKAEAVPPSATMDAGAPGARKERPFASSPVEAQAMIQSEIDGQITALWKCVEDYRVRVKDPHRDVLVDVGIDQEGLLMAVTTATPKQGEIEPALKDCLYGALRNLAFPRSHAGVITVRESLKDTAVYR